MSGGGVVQLLMHMTRGRPVVSSSPQRLSLLPFAGTNACFTIELKLININYKL